jgi:EAL domain-containing protein (putative c-di-GMP-specific phosphodiesterase class I)
MRQAVVSEPIELDARDLRIRRMLKALEREEFVLHYQPQVRTESGDVAGAEALIRWQHPSRGLLVAACFLPALQDFRFARFVGEWTAWRARRDIERWRREGLKTVPVAVNIHPEHLAVPEFASMFLAASGGTLDIEIVEAALGRGEDILPALRALRAAGVRVLLDDFGIGYSSLGRLTELPIDVLKIDKTFISALALPRPPAHRRRARRILATIVSLAHICMLTTIAEGVETRAEFAAIAALGCDQSQGYLHSPAVSAARFAEFLLPVGTAHAGSEPSSQEKRADPDRAIARDARPMRRP